jgi:hypothetical protein
VGTEESIVTVAASTAVAGEVLKPFVTEKAESLMTTVPSVEHKTVNVTEVPDATEAEIVEQLAVPEAFTKSVMAIPETEEVKSTV